MTLTIIQDTKEKQPWNFSIYGYEQVAQHLATGDYTIEGYENTICIERKKSPAELALNLGKERARFERELLRMEEFRFRYIICEFTAEELAKFPVGAKIPKYLKKRIRVRGKYMSKVINELCEGHGIELLFCNGKADAEKQAYEILQQAYGVLSEEG